MKYVEEQRRIIVGILAKELCKMTDIPDIGTETILTDLNCILIRTFNEINKLQFRSI